MQRRDEIVFGREHKMELGNCAQAFLVWYSYRMCGDVPRESNVVKVGSEVLSFL